MRKLLSLLTALLLVGSVWATDPTITITRDSVTTANNYGTDSEWSAGDISGYCQIYGSTTESLQFNGGKPSGTEGTGSGQVVKSRRLWNTVAVPGRIKSVTITTASGTERAWRVFCGTSAATRTSDANYGTEFGSSQNASASGTTWNIPNNDENNYTYFLAYSNSANASYIASIVVTYEASGDVIVKTLKSIAVAGMTTEYEKNDEFSFDGTCTATYSVTKNDEPQADEVKNVTPTSVSTPNMATIGEQEITVTFTDKEVTKTAKYNINVIALLSKSTLAFSAKCNGKGTADDGLAWTVASDAAESNFDDARGVHYGTGSASVSYLELNSAAFYKNIKKIEVEAAGGNTPSLVITVGEEMFGDSAKNITNSNVKYTFQPTNEQSGTDFYGAIKVRLAKTSKVTGALYVKSVVVKYYDFDDQVITFANCANGTISATVKSAAIESDDEISVGDTVVLSKTPAEGYKFMGYDVYKTGEPATTVSVSEDAFVMPPFPVTVSGSFAAIKNLTSIEVTTLPTQTTFWQGETFNSTGLGITAHYDDASSAVVTPTSITGSTATAGNNVTVTVSYEEGGNEEETTYTIVVKAISNTQETAYTVAEARDIIDKVETNDSVYVTGLIQSVTGYSDQYKSITYWISDDGTTLNRIKVYSGKGLNKADFSAKEDLSAGDSVTIKGVLLLYNTDYEINLNNYLVARTPVHAVTFAKPENGTLVIKKRGTAIKSGDKILEGTELTVEATPVSGYHLSALTAGGSDIKEAMSFTVGTSDIEVVAEFSVGTGLDNTDAEVKAVKTLVNGQLFIEKNGHTYNAMGQMIK